MIVPVLDIALMSLGRGGGEGLEFPDYSYLEHQTPRTTKPQNKSVAYSSVLPSWSCSFTAEITFEFWLCQGASARTIY